jgi:hypothetical protein
VLCRRLITLFTSACRCVPPILPACVHCRSHHRQEHRCNHLYWHPPSLSGFALSSPCLSGETDINPIGAMGKVRIFLNFRRVFATPEQHDPSPLGYSAGVCAGGSWQHNVESDGRSHQRCRREPSGGHDAGARHAVPVLSLGVTRFCRTSKPGCFSGNLQNSSFSRSLWEFLLGWPSQSPHTCFFRQHMSSVAMKCPPPRHLRG